MIIRNLSHAIVGLLAFSACQRQPGAGSDSKTPLAEEQQVQKKALPVWVTALIKQQPPKSATVIEESTYLGRRAFLIMPSDRADDSGNEHILRSEDGRIICEFGGLGGHVSVGSCDMDAIVFVQSLYPNGGL